MLMGLAGGGLVAGTITLAGGAIRAVLTHHHSPDSASKRGALMVARQSKSRLS